MVPNLQYLIILHNLKVKKKSAKLKSKYKYYDTNS